MAGGVSAGMGVGRGTCAAASIPRRGACGNAFTGRLPGDCRRPVSFADPTSRKAPHALDNPQAGDDVTLAALVAAAVATTLPCVLVWVADLRGG